MLGMGRRKWLGLLAAFGLLAATAAWMVGAAARGSRYDARPILGLDAQGRLWRTSSPIPLLPRLRMVEHVTNRGPRSVWVEYDTSGPTPPAVAADR